MREILRREMSPIRIIQIGENAAAMARSRRRKITAGVETSQTVVVSAETRAETEGIREAKIAETTAGIRERAAAGIMERGITGHAEMKTVETGETRGQETAEMTAAVREMAREAEPVAARRGCAEAHKVGVQVHKVGVQVHKVHVQVHLAEGRIITAAVSGCLRGLKRRRAVLTGSNRSRRIPARGIKRRRKREHTKSPVKRK